MKTSTIETSVNIKAPLDNVWRVFTDPEVTRRMGGYYETGWKIGNAFGFRNTDGHLVTQGTLMEFQPQKCIRHSLFEPDSRNIMAVLTYEFTENNGETLLVGKEELAQPLDTAGFEDTMRGWETALKAVKEIAESL